MHDDTTAEVPIEESAEGPAEGPEDGHTFAISYRSRGSYKVVGDAEHHDEPDYSGSTHRVEVRAWNLRDALRRAAELPFGVLMGEDSEVDEALAVQDAVEQALRDWDMDGSEDYPTGARAVLAALAGQVEHEGEGMVGGHRAWQVGEQAFMVRRSRGDTYWVIAGPDGSTGGWGAYFLQNPAEDTAERLGRAYQVGHAAGLVKGLTGATGESPSGSGEGVRAEGEVDRMARVLMAAWEQAEGTDVGVSYVATFVDLARAALGAEPTCRRCGMVVHDFHGDRVWRDADGGLTCDQLPVRVNSPFHVVVAEQVEQVEQPEEG